MRNPRTDPIRVSRRRGRWTIALALGLMTAMVGCTTASSPSGSAPQPRAGDSAEKHLSIGILEEPKGWAPWTGATTAGGSQQPRWLVTRTLTVIDGGGEVQPELAFSVPSLERGDWRIFPDGTMEQTWTIRSDARWHDGQPLVAEDFVFGWEMVTHRALPNATSLARLHITEAVARDPHTLMLRFRGATPFAGTALYDPYPRHLLAEAVAGDPEQFINHDYWTVAYVGAGPYRLTSWQPGTLQTFSAFTDYVGGRPKIDSVTIRFLQDPNTLLANLLGGEVHVALPDGLSIDSAAELRRGWAAPGTGNAVIIFTDGRVYRMEFQHRPEYAQPASARNPKVRQAFYHTIDKHAVNEVELSGLGVLADAWVPPDDPRRPQFTHAIPGWSFDLGRAQGLLDEAGWRRGPDGVLVHGGTGERLDSEIRVTAGQGHVRAMAVMAGDWRKVGATVSEVAIAAALLSNGEYRSSFPFVGLTGHPITPNWELVHYSCSRVARPETRWTGNRNGYCNPSVEPLIDRLQITINDAERTALQRDIMRVVNKEDFAQLYLYWQVASVVHSSHVVGLGPLLQGPFGGAQSPWNIHLWEMRL